MDKNAKTEVKEGWRRIERNEIYARVVVLLIDHVHLRPGGELHVVVRALQACIILN